MTGSKRMQVLLPILGRGWPVDVASNEKSTKPLQKHLCSSWLTREAKSPHYYQLCTDNTCHYIHSCNRDAPCCVPMA